MEEKQTVRAPKEEDREPPEEKPLKKLESSLISSGVGEGVGKGEAFGEEKSCRSETLVGKASGECDQSSNCGEFNVKPVIATPLASFDPVEYKVGQLGMSHQEVFRSLTVQAQAHKKIQNEYTPSPVALKPSVSSAISSSPLQQRPSPLENDNNKCKPETELDNSPDQEVELTYFTVTPTNDGYNWRKYGEKLVKNSRSSRSYYRCTTSNCHTKKKVEKCDVSGNLIEITYRGRHNHDPPQKVRRTKARKSVSAAGPGRGSGLIDCPVKQLIDSDPSSTQREARQATLEHQLSAKQCDQANSIKSDGDHLDEPHSKQRMKGTSLADPVSIFKHVKEPKIVVQAASDVGTSGDGYRWRKYGQKMVKGNPNPRSYYKCTSSGCRVRKHVERATDDTTAMVITYEGQHDHDMPVPKKRHGPPSAALLIAAAAAAAALNGAQLKKPETLANHKISAQWSMDMDSRLENKKAPEPESARTLLSIGIELGPY